MLKIVSGAATLLAQTSLASLYQIYDKERLARYYGVDVDGLLDDS